MSEKIVEEYLSISEMAETHNISRQTLIYYDKIELFKPIYIDNNGYRYYSPYQIPFLREICFLKSIGIKLKDIKNHIKNRNPSTAVSLLEYHKEFIDKKINNLLIIRESIKQRLNIYTNVDHFKDEVYKPRIKEFPERKVVFFPFVYKICKQELHFTMMKIWNVMIKNGMLPSKDFGVIIRKKSLKKDNIFDGSGVYAVVSITDCNIENIITLPAGKYVCMYKYGMPYDTNFLYSIIEWINNNNYKIVGDIVDACLLDTTFYEENNDVDFCELQIPIK